MDGYLSSLPGPIVGAKEDPLSHARTTYANPIERLLIAPYWVHYHAEHHAFMHVPCYRLEQLIGILLGRLREEAEAALGEPVTAAVVGRPVRFVGAADAEDEALALTRLRAALTNAGFRSVRFEYEPIGAARHYERGLERDELLLIGDFGGGTSDFSLLRVGPVARGGGAGSILGNAGVDVAGDAFDGKIVRHCVAPLLGRGAEFVSCFGRRLPVPAWLERKPNVQVPFVKA